MTPPVAAPARPTTCLYCGREIPGRPIRGCCTGRCAYLEHDAADEWEPPERDT